MNPPASNPEIYNLSECLLKADDLRHREMFKVTSLGMVTSTRKHIYSPEETSVRMQLLMDNKADQRGYSVFLLLETADGRKGYLVEEQHDLSDGRATSFVNEIPGVKAEIPKRPSSWFRSLGDLFS